MQRAFSAGKPALRQLLPVDREGMKQKISNERKGDGDGEQAQKSDCIAQNQLLFLLPFLRGEEIGRASCRERV